MALPILQDHLRKQLDAIRKGIDSASEDQYQEGLKRLSEHRELYAALTSPLFEPEIDEMPPPMQDEDSGEVIELLEPRADLSDIRAEGTGKEVLLQVTQGKQGSLPSNCSISTLAMEFNALSKGFSNFTKIS